MAKLISFDIDGTFELGDPPGTITIAMVMKAKEMGYFIGSSSDRPIAVQKMIWERAKIEVDFVCLKHNIETLRDKFPADEYTHIGDTDLDRHFAVMAGFEFLSVQKDKGAPWMLYEQVEG